MSSTWPADLAVGPEQLRIQLDFMKNRGYRATTFSEAVSSTPGERVVAITFDDGYRSTIDAAFPVLSAIGVPATLFVPTDHIGSGRPMSWPGIDQWMGGVHEEELLPMSWAEVGVLAEAGWEIGSHSCSHPHLTQLDDATLEHELAESRRRCEEQLQRPCPTLAYPYGDADERVVLAARSAGYSYACLLPAGFTKPAPLEWPRVGIYRNDSMAMFRMKTSPLVRMVRSTPLWAGLDATRRLVVRRMRFRRS